MTKDPIGFTLSLLGFLCGALALVLVIFKLVLQ